MAIRTLRELENSVATDSADASDELVNTSRVSQTVLATDDVGRDYERAKIADYLQGQVEVANSMIELAISMRNFAYAAILEDRVAYIKRLRSAVRSGV